MIDQIHYWILCTVRSTAASLREHQVFAALLVSSFTHQVKLETRAEITGCSHRLHCCLPQDYLSLRLSTPLVVDYGNNCLYLLVVGILWAYLTFFSYHKVPFFSEACEKALLGPKCNLLVGYLAVYRICFGMAAFFFLFMILNFGVTSSKECRGGLNNG